MEWICVNAEMPCQFLLVESIMNRLFFPPYLPALFPTGGSKLLQGVINMDVVYFKLTMALNII